KDRREEREERDLIDFEPEDDTKENE
ncbi:MAG: hypothetical protein QOH68_2689, partial [Nocardioidaceae bacterium]|nr:hypothetical protein [Nocardioidaceae bacterium]